MRVVSQALVQAGVQTWLDEKDIPVGVKWYEYIFSHIDECEGALVFLGPHGIGPVQSQEIERVLREFERLGKPIVPVLLPGYHEEAPPLPTWIQSQLVSEWNYIDLSIDPAAMLVRLVGALATHPVQSASAIASAAASIPRTRSSVLADGWVVVSWIALHAIGYFGISLLVQSRTTIAQPTLYAWLITGSILAALVATGWRALRSRDIRPDWQGAFVGVGSAILATGLVVGFAPEHDGGVRAIGAVATTVAAGLLAGLSAGWVAGCVVSSIAGTGAFIAAVLVPIEAAPIPAQSLVGTLGAMIWGALLATLILKLIRRSTQFRAMFRD